MEQFKPSQIVIAARLMWGIWGVMAAYLISAFIVLITRNDVVAAPLGVSYVIAIVAVAFLIRGVASGKNWARMIYAVLACLTIFSSVAQLLTSPGSSIFQSAISIILVVAYVVVLGLLFHPRARPWFKTAAAIRPN